MYCPACDKEFSPVHSRCPECKGWLRVSGPTVGAKAGGKTGGAPTPPPARATSAPTESVPTNKVPLAPVTAANVTLPSRPKSSTPPTPVSLPPGAPATPPAAPAARAPIGLGADWSAAPESPSPSPGPASPGSNSFSSPPEPAPMRGGLGSGWESSGSFPAPAAPATSWSAPGNSSAAPAASAGWGSPQPPAATGSGWGNPEPARPPSGGLGSWGGGEAAAPAPAFPSAPGPGPTASQPSGGWLGDGGGGPSVYSPPSKSSGWLGDNGSQTEPAPLSAPSLGAALPSLSESPVVDPADSPVLALPDHTVAVDLGTPWEEDAPSAPSNSWVYMVLAGLLVGLLGFFGYTYWTRQRLAQPSQPVKSSAGASSLDAGLASLRQGQRAYAAKQYREAQASAETANTLIVGLSVAPPAKVKEVKEFYRRATTRYASSLFDQANRAVSAGDLTQAANLCHQAADFYSRISGTARQQAQAYGLEGRILVRMKDYTGAERSFRDAVRLNPGGGYQAMLNQARRAQSDTLAPAAPAPAPVAAPEPPPVADQPSLGDYPTGNYPTGSHGGGYRPSAPAAAPAAAPGGPSRPRPVNNYVPPKRDNTPSFMKKRDQRPPGY